MKRITLLSILSLTIFSSSLHAQTATNVSARSLQLLGGTTDITKKITLAAPSSITGTGYTLTLPPDDGAADQVLRTDGSGVLSWVTASGGGSSSITDNGTTLSLGSNMSVTLATGTITTSGNILLTNSGTAGSLSLQGTGSGASTFKAGAQSGTTINYTLPTTQPSTNQVLAATSVSGSGPYDVATGWATPAIAYLGGTSGIPTNTGDFYSPFGWGQPTSEAGAQIVATRSGSLKNLYVKLSAAPVGATKSKTVTVRINGANTGLTVTITNTATTGNNTGTTVTFNAGDLISITVTHANAPNASIVGWGLEMY